MVDSDANASKVRRYQQLCRLCASDTRAQANINGFDCKNSLNLMQTIEHLYGVQIRRDDKISTIICSDCLDEVFHFEGHYRKVQRAQLQFAKYQLMIKSTNDRAALIDDETDSGDDDRVTSSAPNQNHMGYSCTVVEKQSISAHRNITPQSSGRQSSIVCGDPIEIKCIGSAESTVITIGKPYARHAKSSRIDNCTQNFGTMTVTTIPMSTTRLVARKRPTDGISDSDKNSQNVPANEQSRCKARKTTIGTSTKMPTFICEPVSPGAMDDNSTDPRSAQRISSKQKVSSCVTVCDVHATHESGSGDAIKYSSCIRVRDLRSLQS